MPIRYRQAVRQALSTPMSINNLDYLHKPPEVQLNDADLVMWTYILARAPSRQNANAPVVWLQVRLKMPTMDSLYKEVYRAVAGARPEIVPAQKEGYRILNCCNGHENEFDGFLRSHLADLINISNKFDLYVDHAKHATGWAAYCYYEQPLAREMREALKEAEEDHGRRQSLGEMAKVMKGMRR